MLLRCKCRHLSSLNKHVKAYSSKTLITCLMFCLLMPFKCIVIWWHGSVAGAEVRINNCRVAYLSMTQRTIVIRLLVAISWHVSCAKCCVSRCMTNVFCIVFEKFSVHFFVFLICGGGDHRRWRKQRIIHAALP